MVTFENISKIILSQTSTQSEFDSKCGEFINALSTSDTMEEALSRVFCKDERYQEPEYFSGMVGYKCYGQYSVRTCYMIRYAWLFGKCNIIQS